MPVVTDTSPIMNLAIIGELSLLRDQFGEVLIPRAVLEELRVEENLPGSQSVRDALKAGWIRIEAVKQDPLVRAMERDLDKGEAEAIALAMQVNADWVLMDERDGRKAAKSMKLKMVGVLGILLKAQREGRLKSLKQAMDRLREKAGFYVRADLYSAIIGEGEEEK
jgi:predicted nucleic acid-binding protein